MKQKHQELLFHFEENAPNKLTSGSICIYNTKYNKYALMRA